MRAGMLTARPRARWSAALLLPAVLALAACASGTAGRAADLVVPPGATAPDPTASAGDLVDDDPAAGERAVDGPAVDGAEPTALTDASAAEEYAHVVAEIGQPLPAGLDYPAGLPDGFVPAEGRLEAGAARNQAWFTWLCAWEGEYLTADAAQDPDRQRAAAAMLEWYVTAPFYSEVVSDPEGGWVHNVLGPMRLGDPSGVRADNRQTCGAYPTVPSGTSG